MYFINIAIILIPKIPTPKKIIKTPYQKLIISDLSHPRPHPPSWSFCVYKILIRNRFIIFTYTTDMKLNTVFLALVLLGLITINSKLIFEDNFTTFDMTKWKHDITLSGGGNW